ncbi:MAG TPA: dTDP-4-dehydrorhamnose reductase [Phnomibacter sp.]|nr:dTDP-4-dehydrorhamnose reductase [Phnomibacter sp.]
MKILVSGANGQLGKCLQDVAVDYPEHQLIFLGREHFALEQFGMVHAVLQNLQPDMVINAAAYTAVDKAEQEVDLAMLINGEAVGNLAKICHELGIRLIHISTDYVFDGTASTPYVETDAVHPMGVYGKSKLLGEQLVLANHPESIIIRTSWVYSRHGHNFVKTMLRLMKEKEQIGVVSDQLGCPTYAIDLADAILKIASQKSKPGVYHFANEGVISWHQFAKAIQEITGSTCIVNAIKTAQYPTPAKRPAYSALDTTHIANSFGISIPHWKQSLEACLTLL